MRRLLAAMTLVLTAVLAGCSTEPNSLFDAAGYHVRDGTVYYLNAFPGKAFQIDDADARTFEALDATYGRDHGAVYLDGRRLAPADPATFDLLPRPGYARDGGHVFVRDRVLSTDPAHFELLDGGLSRDSAAVYRADGSVLSHDSRHFEIVSDTDHYLFGKNGAAVYVNGDQILGADPRTFPANRRVSGCSADDITFAD